MCHSQSVEINTFKEVAGVRGILEKKKKENKRKIKFIIGKSDMLCWSEKVLVDVVMKSMGVWKGAVTE